MCVLDEDEFLFDAIGSLQLGLNQIVVIDQSANKTSSTKGTCDFYGVPRIWTRGENFLTRGEQFFRNLAIDLCFCDWLMVTDGDEIMGPNWWKPIRDFIESPESEGVGAIRCNYWQMIGSSGYHTLNSPLNYESGERPLLYRMNPNLRSGDPMAGTKVHCSAVGIEGRQARVEGVDCWHMGYAKSDMEARFRRNIERGDWTQDDAKKAEFYATAHANPLSLLPECVPLEISKERLPVSLREPEWVCDYDSATRRIKSRRPA
jgi:hypothetical protein